MSARKRVAVMQPYFFPYAGYFRLLCAADHFVILDTVQFPRRGRVHRCQIPGSDGEEKWLTLPIEKCALSTAISDIRFHDDASALFERRIDQTLRLFRKEPGFQKVRDSLLDNMDTPIEYLSLRLRNIAELLRFEVEITRSSQLPDPECCDYQDRIIGIVKALGGTDYINLPGGVELYNPERFRQGGINLHFLTPYMGNYRYLIPALICASTEDIRTDVLKTTQFING